MNFPFYTIGYSTRPLETFVELLQTTGVSLVADVRTVPKSRTNPQYNKEALPESLAAYQIAYEHIAELGGLRGKVKVVAAEMNGYWENQSFHNYADYAAFSEIFQNGLDRLIALGRERRCAMMCSEAVWWRCHRRLIADHLIARGETVFHLMGNDRIEPARLTKGAQIQRSGAVLYPAQESEA